MSRKRSNMNKKLNRILLFMTALLAVLIVIVYIDTYKSSNNKIANNSSGISESGESHDNN